MRYPGCFSGLVGEMRHQLLYLSSVGSTATPPFPTMSPRRFPGDLAIEQVLGEGAYPGEELMRMVDVEFARVVRGTPQQQMTLIEEAEALTLIMAKRFAP